MSNDFAKTYNEQITDEARNILKTTRMDLDAFLALSGDERARRWRGLDLTSKQDLVIQQLGRLGHDWTDAVVAEQIAKYDAKWEISDTAIPPAAEIAALAKERGDDAQRVGDWGGAAQLARVRKNVLSGAPLLWHLGDLLVSSLNTPGAVYVVNSRGCSCPNGRNGKAQCWHVALFDLLAELRQTAADSADIAADAAAPCWVCSPADPCDADDPCPGHADLVAELRAAGVSTAYDLEQLRAERAAIHSLRDRITAARCALYSRIAA